MADKLMSLYNAFSLIGRLLPCLCWLCLRRDLKCTVSPWIWMFWFINYNSHNKHGCFCFMWWYMNVRNSIEAILTRTVNYVALSFANFPFYEDSMCRWWKGFYLSKLEYNANGKQVYGICRLHCQMMCYELSAMSKWQEISFPYDVLSRSQLLHGYFVVEKSNHWNNGQHTCMS